MRRSRPIDRTGAHCASSKAQGLPSGHKLTWTGCLLAQSSRSRKWLFLWAGRISLMRQPMPDFDPMRPLVVTEGLRTKVDARNPIEPCPLTRTTFSTSLTELVRPPGVDQPRRSFPPDTRRRKPSTARPSRRPLRRRPASRPWQPALSSSGFYP